MCVFVFCLAETDTPKRIIMKTLHVLNIFITVALWVSAPYFIEWHDNLSEAFFKVGWQNYEGVSLRTPGIYFSRFVLLAVAFIVYTGIQTYRKHDWRWIGVLLFIVAGMFLFLELLVLSKEIHLSQKHLWRWQYLFGCNIALSVIAFLKLEYRKPIPLVSNDILDDPNSITHHEPGDNL